MLTTPLARIRQHPAVILSGVVVRGADDNAVEEPAPSGAEGTPRPFAVPALL